LLVVDALCLATVTLADRALTGWRAYFSQHAKWVTDRQ
jgi:hypothetical protein